MVHPTPKYAKYPCLQWSDFYVWNKATVQRSSVISVTLIEWPLRGITNLPLSEGTGVPAAIFVSSCTVMFNAKQLQLVVVLCLRQWSCDSSARLVCRDQEEWGERFSWLGETPHHLFSSPSRSVRTRLCWHRPEPEISDQFLKIPYLSFVHFCI